jgi:hypothetical protein
MPDHPMMIQPISGYSPMEEIPYTRPRDMIQMHIDGRVYTRGYSSPMYGDLGPIANPHISLAIIRHELYGLMPDSLVPNRESLLIHGDKGITWASLRVTQRAPSILSQYTEDDPMILQRMGDKLTKRWCKVHKGLKKSATRYLIYEILSWWNNVPISGMIASRETYERSNDGFQL